MVMLDKPHAKYFNFPGTLLIIGFGSVAKTVLPLILRHITIAPSQILIITEEMSDSELVREYNIPVLINTITKENYTTILNKYLKPGDFLLNLTVDVCSLSLIAWCQQHQVLYLDTGIEPWPGGYFHNDDDPSLCLNYFLRQYILDFKAQHHYKTTAVITHGANPGLVSHFLKQALVNMAHKAKLLVNEPTTQSEWAQLSKTLGIKSIQIAERDSQHAVVKKLQNEIVNTWSIEGFLAEIILPAELGWGTHEKQLPADANHHEFGLKNAIYLNSRGCETEISTWTPLLGAHKAYLITHAETISISAFLTLNINDKVDYRPTVNFAYLPCADAVSSLEYVKNNKQTLLNNKRILFNEIDDGYDELGILLMGNKLGAYWFGSQLSIHEARDLVKNSTATSLQVAIGVLSGMIWALHHPCEGIVEPENMDHSLVLKIAAPYLGTFKGYLTSWRPDGKQNGYEAEQWQFEEFRLS